VDEFTTSVTSNDPDAIASVINQALQSWQVEAQVAIAPDSLEVTLIAPPECESSGVITALKQEITALSLTNIVYLSLDWQIQGETSPQWHQEIELNTTDLVVQSEAESQLATPKKGRFGDLAGQFGKLKAVSKTVTQAGKSVTETASSLVGQTKSQASETFTKATTNVGGLVENTTTQAQNLMTGASGLVGNTVGNTASQASETLTKATTNIGGLVENTTTQAQNLMTGASGLVGNTVGNTASQAQNLIAGASNIVGGAVNTTGQTFSTVGNTVGNTANKAKESLGQAAQFVAESPLLEQIINNVDLVKAEEKLARMQAQHPNEAPAQISRRMMLEKAVYAGGTGLATSIVPGAIAALIAVDLAAVAALQAEMVYQISGAYGLDLQASERKSEILAIFGLALGSGHAVRAGVTLLQATPVLGAAIGASSNAAMIYAVGYAACRFYEAKLQGESSESAAIASAQVGEEVLEDAIAQETAMDRVLVQLLRAGYPEKTWAELQPELTAAHLSPASLETLEAHFDSPEPLDTLLAQINPDFAVSLLVQCQKIAELDGVVNAEEAAILEQIRQTFQINLAALLESQLS